MALSNFLGQAQSRQIAQQQPVANDKKPAAQGAQGRFDQRLNELNDARMRAAKPRTASQFLRGGKDVQR